MNNPLKKMFSFLMAAIMLLFPWLVKNKVDSDFKIELKSNPSTGYSWTCEFEKEGIIKLVSKSYSDSFNNPEGKIHLVGAPGIESFYFDCLSKGKTRVYFTYSRAWEKSEYDSTRIFSVTVDESLKATVSEITR